MTPTPRTDALELENIGLAWGDAQDAVLGLARELERELTESAQSLAFQTQLNREVIELEKKTLGERNDARAELAAERALADRLAETLANVQGDYASTGAIVPSEVDDALTAWKQARNE
jgi:hypothetical protein